MNTLRECAEAAVKASGADGWQITGGTAHAWAVTLYFNRDGKDVVARGPSKTIVGLTDEAIGRAACIVPDDWDYDGGVYQEIYIKSGLAAVAEARRLDTCETCEYGGRCTIQAALLWAAQYPTYAPMATYSLEKWGCVRHQPKET